MSETIISKSIADYLNARGIYNLRVNSGRVRVRGGWMHCAPEGTPDRFFLMPGLWGGLEIKVPGEKPTAAQLEQHMRIRLAGGIVIVARSVEDVERGLKEKA